MKAERAAVLLGAEVERGREKQPLCSIDMKATGCDRMSHQAAGHPSDGPSRSHMLTYILITQIKWQQHCLHKGSNLRLDSCFWLNHVVLNAATLFWFNKSAGSVSNWQPFRLQIKITIRVFRPCRSC